MNIAVLSTLSTLSGCDFGNEGRLLSLGKFCAHESQLLVPVSLTSETAAEVAESDEATESRRVKRWIFSNTLSDDEVGASRLEKSAAASVLAVLRLR